MRPSVVRRATVEERGGELQTKLLKRIVDAYPQLSPQMQRVARDVECHAWTLGIDTIQTVAERCAVPPSAIVRFARQFGYRGFRQFREVFRAGIRSSPRPAIGNSRVGVLARIVERANLGLASWECTLDEKALARASIQLCRARRIRIIGTPEAAPITSFVFHALLEIGRIAELVTSFSGVGPAYPDDVWLLADLGAPSPCLDAIVSELRSLEAHLVLLTDGTEFFHLDRHFDVLVIPDVGGLDFDGIMAALMVCGVVVALLENELMSVEVDQESMTQG